MWCAECHYYARMIVTKIVVNIMGGREGRSGEEGWEGEVGRREREERGQGGFEGEVEGRISISNGR